MDYIEESLMPGERVVYTTRLHWGMVVRSVLGFLIGATLLTGVIVVAALTLSSAREYAPCLVIAIVFLALGVILAAVKPIGAIIAWFTTEFGVTNKRVLIKKGLLRRQSLEIILSQVEGVSVDENFSGRIFGYGTLVITGSGGTVQRFDAIRAPFELRKHVMEQIEEQEKPIARKRK